MFLLRRQLFSAPFRLAILQNAFHSRMIISRQPVLLLRSFTTTNSESDNPVNTILDAMIMEHHVKKTEPTPLEQVNTKEVKEEKVKEDEEQKKKKQEEKRKKQEEKRKKDEEKEEKMRKKQQEKEKEKAEKEEMKRKKKEENEKEKEENKKKTGGEEVKTGREEVKR